MKRLAITIAVIMGVMFTPAFSANSVATQINNGAKLMLKEGTDSLFYTYWDANGSVKYAYSGGDGSWDEELVIAARDFPAIAADSTDKRWIAARKPGSGNQNALQQLYCLSGGMWTAVNLYETDGNNTLGPASIAGASSTTTGIAYTTFRLTVGSTHYVIVTKFNGTTVAACTLATGANLGDPAVAVEPYKTDSDRVYVVWENANVIYYCMDVDGRGSGIAGNWGSNVGLSDELEPSDHPSINADRGRVVVAWEQGSSGPDIYARECLNGTWADADNVSNTLTESSYPTIALGDTVVVAWDEYRDSTDYDIFACINFGNTINIADNATISLYPHIVLQETGGHLYLHTIWSEPNYVVDYDKRDLR
jgi:hypothetical protein